jgi:hypothetical protein
MKLNKKQSEKIEETLKDFKCLLFRYRETRNDKEKLKSFFSRNRNPIWDITNIKYFQTGLMSESAKKEYKTNLVDDHFIQRSKSLKFIFEELDIDEDMSNEKFITLIKKYCSTVKLTKEEHSKITIFNKNNPESLNYETYSACGIVVSGLSDFILK